MAFKGKLDREVDQTAADPAGTFNRPRKRRSLEELTPATKQRIFNAAARVVGEYGYANASTKRIAEAAGIAEGTIYLYFPSRQNLFDELLPHVGGNMLRYIRDQIAGAEDIYDMEERGFRAFFAFLKNNPGFFRVLNEAESAAPAAHREHFRLLGDNYLRALQRGITRGQIRNYSPAELETVAYMLMASRSYLHMRHLREAQGVKNLPEEVVQTYMKFVRGGLK